LPPAQAEFDIVKHAMRSAAISTKCDREGRKLRSMAFPGLVSD